MSRAAWGVGAGSDATNPALERRALPAIGYKNDAFSARTNEITGNGFVLSIR